MYSSQFCLSKYQGEKLKEDRIDKEFRHLCANHDDENHIYVHIAEFV